MPKKQSNDTRPINLALWTMRFPVTAIVSILHRISGFVLYISIPFIIYALQYSLTSTKGFAETKLCFSTFIIKTGLWLVICGLMYHIIAGTRHLLMDMHFGDSKSAARLSSYIVFGLTAALALMVGIYLW